jgi:hypothetical protein
MDHLDTNGWPSIWFTIIGTTQNDASTWASTYGLDPATVLYDDAGWASQGVTTGVPTVYLVHTSNMLIWDRTEGWYDTSGAEWEEVKDWYTSSTDGLLPYIAAQSGSIAP